MSRLASLLCVAALSPTALPVQAGVFDGIEPESTVVVPAFRYGEQRAFSGDLVLRRIDIYAPDARVYVAGPGGLAEIPRSDLRLFVADREREPQRMYLAVSADGRRFEGAVFEADGTYAIAGRIEASGLQVDSSERVEDRAEPFRCSGGLEAPPGPLDARGGEKTDTTLPASTTGATHQAVVAVDTDNEFMNLKFSNNQTAANDYIAQLFTGINVFYERDLSVRLQLGTVILRPSTTTDPYPSAPGSDIGDQLDEFGDFWRLNQQAIPRAFAAMLSGKSSSPNTASGIAWLLTSGSYCAATGQVFSGGVFGHYGVTRVFRFGGSTAANDVSIVGHELGHNFGAEHTHCSSIATGQGPTATNTIDRCFSGEPSCYSGAVSCPTDNSVTDRGSLMSYCNFSSPAANCGALLQEFHPAHQTFLGTRIATNIGNGCFASLVTDVGPQVIPASPASGSTTHLGGGWDGNQVNGSVTFNVSGGSGSGTTQLTCSTGSGPVQVVSGTPQTIAVGGSAQPVGVRFTLTGLEQEGAVNCSAERVGGASSDFSYTFTVAAGSAQPASRVFCSGFENGEVVSCLN